MTDSDLEFLYVGDPMCSWCWGFAPTLERVRERYRIPLATIVGGLRPGPNAARLDDGMREMLLHHWEEVAARSGQPFDRTGLDREDWVYDTELPARAVVTMRRLAPAETFPFFASLQRAFYAEAVDITAVDEYPRLVEPFPVDTSGFVEALRDERSREEAWGDFSHARRLGVAGFPALLLRTSEGYVIVTRGYLPFEVLEPALTGWLAERHPAEIESLVCPIGEIC
jgi:putative protein-disulfide isomerase